MCASVLGPSVNMSCHTLHNPEGTQHCVTISENQDSSERNVSATAPKHFTGMTTTSNKQSLCWSQAWVQCRVFLTSTLSSDPFLRDSVWSGVGNRWSCQGRTENSSNAYTIVRYNCPRQAEFGNAKISSCVQVHLNVGFLLPCVGVKLLTHPPHR